MKVIGCFFVIWKWNHITYTCCDFVLLVVEFRIFILYNVNIRWQEVIEGVRRMNNGSKIKKIVLISNLILNAILGLIIFKISNIVYRYNRTEKWIKKRICYILFWNVTANNSFSLDDMGCFSCFINIFINIRI